MKKGAGYLGNIIPVMVRHPDLVPDHPIVFSGRMGKQTANSREGS